MAEESAFLDKDVFEGTKEKLGLYLEELPSENGGWGMTTGMQLADGVRDWYGVISTTRHGDPVKAAQDVLVVLAIHAHTLSFHPRQHRPHTPRRYPRQTHRPRYQWMDIPPPRANVGKDCSRARAYDCAAHRNGLGRRMARYMVVCAVPRRVRESTGLPHPAAA